MLVTLVVLVVVLVLVVLVLLVMLVMVLVLLVMLVVVLVLVMVFLFFICFFFFSSLLFCLRDCCRFRPCPFRPVCFRHKVVKEHQRSSRVMITGHSLGGYAAEIISTTLNIAGAGFQAPGPNTIVGTKHNGPHKHAGFRCINAFHDPIGNLLPGTFTHLQWTVYARSTVMSLPPASHKITNMIHFLEGCTSKITNYNVYEYTTHGFFEMGQYTLYANTQRKP